MRDLEILLARNKSWAASMTSADPEFFSRLSHQQNPKYLWIGCSDSRVPANQIVDLLPGEVFVHRNIANLVVHSDLNCLSVIQFAVDVLKVQHIIVCGHYGCGGIKAATDGTEHGLIDNWLRHIRDMQRYHRETLDELVDPQERMPRLCELNVIEQVDNVRQTTIVQSAWRAGQDLTIHGWVYGLEDGIIRDLGVSVDAAD